MKTQHQIVAAILAAAAITSFASPCAHADASPSAGDGFELKKEGPPRFYGFSFDFSLYDGSGLNSVNYNNSLSMYFEPTWSLGRAVGLHGRFSKLAVAGRFSLNRALSGYEDANFSQFSDNGYAVRCSNPTLVNGQLDATQINRCQYSSAYRWDQGDLWLTVRSPAVYTIPKINVDLSPSVRFVFPTSAESQYQTLRVSTSALIGASKKFLGDKVKAGYTFGATKYFHQYTTPGVSTDGAGLQNQLLQSGYFYSDIAPTTANFLSDPSHVGTIGGLNSSFGFAHYFSVDYAPNDKLSFSALYIVLNSYAYEANRNTVYYDGNGQTTNVEANCQTVSNGSCGRGHKDTQVLWLTAAYQVNDWLGVSLSWINWAPLRKPDNSLRQGFISTNYDAFTTINFGATVSTEKVLGKLL